MIKIGDKVRFSNKCLAKKELCAPGQKHGRNWHNRHRGEQQVMTVIDICRGKYDWKTKKYTGDLVLLDSGCKFTWFNTFWIRLIRHKKN